MAFRGSTHLADKEMAATLERLGSRLGPDANAETGPDHTTYRFDLPRADDHSVDTGFMLLREVAGALTLRADLMDEERRVILSEERSRAGAEQRKTEILLKSQLGDHPFARSPIGRREAIARLSAGAARGFYEAYYRPERAVLVVVGDIDPARMETKIRAAFSDWRGRGEPRPDPPPVNGDPGGAAVRVATIEGLRLSGLVYYWPQPYQPPAAGRGQSMQNITDSIALSAFSRRIYDLSNRNGKPFMSGGFGRVQIPGVATSYAFQAGGVTDPYGALDLAVKAQRQVLEFGLSQREIDQVVAMRRNNLANWAASSTTRSTPDLADKLLRTSIEGGVHRSPAQDLELFDEATRNLTAAQLNLRLKRMLAGTPGRLVFVGPSPPTATEARLTTALAAAHQSPVQPYVEPQAPTWGHLDFGPMGKVAWRQDVPDLGVTLVRFANGVTLTIKPTGFSENQVLVKVRFGHGRLDLPRDRLTAADWSTVLLSTGGLRDLNSLELGNILAGKGATALVTQEDDAFVISSGPVDSPFSTPPGQLNLQMQLLAALISEPGWRPDVWPNLVGAGRQNDAAAEASPQAVFRDKGIALLHSGDMRWVRSNAAMQAKWTPQEAKAFLAPILASDPLEVIVVGDVGVDQVIAATAKTLGALPARHERPEPEGLRDVEFPKPTNEPIVLHHKGRSDQALVHVSWPTTGKYKDIREFLSASVAADILRRRAMALIRNAEGRAYAPNVQVEFSPSLPAYGRIGVSVLVEPKDVDATYRDIDAIVSDMAAKEMSRDEMALSLGPQMAAIERSLKSNDAWAYYLADAHSDPARLHLIRNASKLMQSLTPTDILASSRRWLVPTRIWRLTILPKN
jgi:zinc protease